MDISTYVLHNLAQTLSLQQQIQRQPHVVPLTQTSRIDKNILKSIGDMKPGDDIFVFLHKFEYNMKALTMIGFSICQAYFMVHTVKHITIRYS